MYNYRKYFDSVWERSYNADIVGVFLWSLQEWQVIAFVGQGFFLFFNDDV